MVITPRLGEDGDTGPRRRAREARETTRAKDKRSALIGRLRAARIARRAQTARKAATARRAASAETKAATGIGEKAGSRFLGPVGVALLFVDAVNMVGSTLRRAEGGISGRLLDAMDQDTIYGSLDETATGAQQGRKNIEGDEDLLKIIGIEGRVNSQIGQLGAWFRQREIARAIGSDLIEREPAFDHLGSIADKAIDGSVHALKTVADKAVNAIRSYQGKGALTR